jgi:hypothetical protein
MSRVQENRSDDQRHASDRKHPKGSDCAGDYIRARLGDPGAISMSSQKPIDIAHGKLGASKEAKK